MRLLPGGGGREAGRSYQMLRLDEEIVFERSSLGAIVGPEMCSTTREAASLAYRIAGSTVTPGETPRGYTGKPHHTLTSRPPLMKCRVVVAGGGMATAALFIPAGGGISAETVELLAQLCAMKKGSLDKPLLSAVFDGETV